jgi:O-6-methylguanine DNA methyltransferase
MAHALIPTPIGPLSIEATDRGISRLDFVRDLEAAPAVTPSATRKRGLGKPHLEVSLPTAGPSSPWERDGVRPADFLIATAATQLDEYFAGERRSFDLPFDLRGTPFQLRVWQAIAAIPYGETVSYADVALAAGNPNAYRAAGTACGANRIVILIPCHRVIGSDRGLHGFGGGLGTKVWLLRHEKAPIASRLPSLALRS